MNGLYVVQLPWYDHNILYISSEILQCYSTILTTIMYQLKLFKINRLKLNVTG